MTRRLALVAAGLAAASFAAPLASPASAAPEPPCFSQEIHDCLRPVMDAVVVICSAVFEDASCHLHGGTP